MKLLTDLKSQHARSILQLGLPMILGQMGVILVGFVDNIMVGQYGTPELGAASFVNNFINLAFILGMGFSYGLTPLVSGSVASGNGQLKTLLKSSLLLNLLVGVVLTLVMGIFWLRLDWLKPPQELIPLISQYYLIQLVSLIPMMAFNTAKQYLDGMGLTRIGMQAILISNAINILFNWLLIFGKLGFPELGLVGAGLSTLGARLFAVVYMWLSIAYSHRVARIVRESCSYAGPVTRSAVQKLTELGVPSGLQMGMEAGSFSLAVIMVGWLGATALAVHQVVNVLSTLGFMIYYGLAAAVTIRVGHYYELRQPSDIRLVTRSGLLLHAIAALIFVIFLLSTRHVVGYLFSPDEDVVRWVALLIVPVCLYQIGDVLQILYSNALRGMQDVRYTVRAAFFTYTGQLTIAYLMAIKWGLGLVGIWMAYPIGLTVLGLLLWGRYRRVVRRLDDSTKSHDHL